MVRERGTLALSAAFGLSTYVARVKLGKWFRNHGRDFCKTTSISGGGLIYPPVTVPAVPLPRMMRNDWFG